MHAKNPPKSPNTTRGANDVARTKGGKPMTSATANSARPVRSSNFSPAPRKEPLELTDQVVARDVR
jgi:hypothetical protein